MFALSALPAWLRRSALMAGVFLSAVTAGAAPAGSYYIQAEAEIVPGQPVHAGLPSKAELDQAGAVLITQGGKWDEAARENIVDYLAKGGGVVLVHDAISASGLVGGEARPWAGNLPLFYTPQGRKSPLTAGISNFDIEDELLHGFNVADSADVLVTTWTPNRKHLKGTEPQPYVYGVSPLVWTFPSGKGRVVCVVPGKSGATFQHPAMRVMLTRALGWAAGKEDPKDLDALCQPQDLAALTYPPGGPLSPRDSLATLKVHPDFTVGLVAAEPLISKPLNIDWDERGRLWVVESVEYPEGRRGGGPESMYSNWQRETNLPKPPAVDRPGHDKVSWLEDTNGDGVMDRKHVFAEDLDLATSFCFYQDGVIVAQPPEILFLRDTDKDGKADKREVLYKGLGTFDTHSVLNNLRWGLDGWVYGTHGYSSSQSVTSGDGKVNFGAIGSGIVRFKPDGSRIEMFSAKSGNCWGVDITSDGEFFFTQPTSGDLVMHVPVPDRIMAEGGMGSEPSWQVMVHLRPVEPLMSHEEIVENQPNDVIGSYTAACGCAVYEGGAWPDEWKLGYFTAEPTVHILHHEKLAQDGVTYNATKVREGEFSATRDFWTRPIDTRIGQDGQLYSIDFYNQAILHNDPRGPIHLWNNQAARPDRDHYFGRIIRYSHKNSTALPRVDLMTLEGRVAALSSPSREVRFRAQRLIEEGDVKKAAGLLANAQGFAHLHALWIRAAAGVLSGDELAKAISFSDVSVRVTAARVIGAHPALADAKLVDAVNKRLLAEDDPRVRLQLLAALPAEAVLPASTLVALQAAAGDRWTLAAVARLARNTPDAVFAETLSSSPPERLAPLAGMLFDSSASDETKLVPMLQALQKASPSPIVMSSLASLRNRELPRGTAVVSALEQLAASNEPVIAANALPLAAGVWSGADRDARLSRHVAAILAKGNLSAAILAPLATLPVLPAPLPDMLKDILVQSDEVRAAVLPGLSENASADAVKLMIGLLPSLSVADKARISEKLLGRPSSANALIGALDDGSLPPAVAGPQLLARLAEHPDEAVRKRAEPVIARFRGAAEAKDAVINRLLPEVSVPGDVEKGKAIFGACAVCHLFKGQGATIGPVLEGMGVHGVEALLTHIVDPNREVEPSYHTWQVTTRDGRNLAGFISRETAGSLFIKNVAGETEIPRDQIASRVDSGKSLMPEGFEAMGAEPLRDLITYLRSGQQRFHVLPFENIATANGNRGVYLSEDTEGDRVSLKRFGLVEEHGIPFHLPDPATAPGAKNVIVLKGGMDPNAVSRKMPQSVEIPVNLAAGRLHLLGGIAGWGFPASGEKTPLVTIKVCYAGGATEDIVLSNGIDIADHVAGVDVPGSVRTDLASRGQVRYLWRDLGKPSVVIEKLIVSSTASIPAPMIAALTLESPSRDGAMTPPPAEGGPAR